MNRSFQKSRADRILRRIVVIERAVRRLSRPKPGLARKVEKLRVELAGVRAKLSGATYDALAVQVRLDSLDAATRRLRNRLGIKEGERD